MGFTYIVDIKSVFKVIEVQKSSTILKNIPEYLINQETCLAAIKANGLALRHVPKSMVTKTLIVHAIRENPQSYFLIQEQEQLYLRYAVRILVKKIKQMKLMDFKF